MRAAWGWPAPPEWGRLLLPRALPGNAALFETPLCDANHRPGRRRRVQRTVNRYGHCAFDPREFLQSFDELVSWTAGGPKPAPGDVTAP